MSEPITTRQIKEKLKLSGGNLTGTLSGTTIIANSFEGPLEGTAEYAINDDAGNEIKGTYVSDLKSEGTTITFYNKIGEELGTITTQDIDNKVHNESNANKLAYITATPDNKTGDGTQIFDNNVYLTENAGELFAKSIKGENAVFTGTISATKILGNSTSAVIADSATKDSNGNNITSTYISSMTVNGTQLTLYNGNNETVGILTIKDDDVKVTNLLDNSEIAYVTGTTSSVSNTGVQVFNTGVYLLKGSNGIFATSGIFDNATVSSTLTAKTANITNANITSTLKAKTVSATNMLTGTISATSLSVDSGISGVADSATNATSAVNASIAEKLGTTNIGNSSQFMYLSSGTAKYSTANIGNASSPVYVKSGVLTAISEVKSATNATSAGVSTKLGTVTVGADNRPIYIKSGIATSISGTYGSSSNPIYIKNGVITECDINFSEMFGDGLNISSGVIEFSNGATISKNGESLAITGNSSKLGETSYLQIYDDKINTVDTTIENGTIKLTALNSAGSSTLVIKPSGEAIYDGKITASSGFVGDLTGTATVATKLGVKNVGADNQPIYLKSGVATAITGSYGNSSSPIYIKNGVYKTCGKISSATSADVALNLGSYTVGDSKSIIYFENGNVLKSTATVGGLDSNNNFKLISVQNGEITESSRTIGTNTNPVYLNNGAITAVSCTVGNTSSPVYFKNGVITSISVVNSAKYATICSDYLPLSGGTVTGKVTFISSDISGNQPVIDNTGNIWEALNIKRTDFSTNDNLMIKFHDDLDELVILETVKNNSSSTNFNIITKENTNSTNASITIHTETNNTYATAPTYKSYTDSSTKIATTAWVRNMLASNTYCSKYLPLSGGTMTGDVGVSTIDFIYKTTDDSHIGILGGKAYASGCASLLLYGKDETNTPGHFVLRANNGTSTYTLTGNPTNGSLSWTGTFTATKVYNAVWNDYAEFFPKGEETEAGDFIGLDLSEDEEKYVKCSSDTSKSVGIHSDSYGHLIGGETPPSGEDFADWNMKKYIPVGLAGRVKAKIIGKIKKGDFIVISDVAGVGRTYDKLKDNSIDIIGMACESSNNEEIKRIKVKLN